jgi:hypothetical protein
MHVRLDIEQMQEESRIDLLLGGSLKWPWKSDLRYQGFGGEGWNIWKLRK